MRGQQGAKFRSRKVVPKQNLIVYREYEVPDIKESGQSHRSAAVMSTGVEKEEEEEHHLQEALHAQTSYGKASVVIPTPDASRPFQDYGTFYAKGYHPPKAYIKFAAPVEDFAGCEYNMDEQDDAWLAEYNARARSGADAALNETQFEWLMWALEKTTNDKLPGDYATETDLESFLLIENAPLVAVARAAFAPVHEYWRHRRVDTRDGRPVHPALLVEDTLKTEENPYVCFRRREIRQLRKTRKLDNLALDKLRRLRDDLCRTRVLFELILKRERLRKQSLAVELLVFEQKVLVRRLRKKLGILRPDSDAAATGKSTKRRRRDTRPSTVLLPLSRLRGLQDELCFSDQNAAEYKARRKKVDDEQKGIENCVEQPFRALEDALVGAGALEPCFYRNLPVVFPAPDAINGFSQNPAAFFSETPSQVDGSATVVSTYQDPRVLPRGRRRVGRGGRIWYDQHVRWRPGQTAPPHDYASAAAAVPPPVPLISLPSLDRSDPALPLASQLEAAARQGDQRAQNLLERARFDDAADIELDRQLERCSGGDWQLMQHTLALSNAPNAALSLAMHATAAHAANWRNLQQQESAAVELRAAQHDASPILTLQWTPPTPPYAGSAVPGAADAQKGPVPTSATPNGAAAVKQADAPDLVQQQQRQMLMNLFNGKGGAGPHPGVDGSPDARGVGLAPQAMQMLLQQQQQQQQWQAWAAAQQRRGPGGSGSSATATPNPAGAANPAKAPNRSNNGKKAGSVASVASTATPSTSAPSTGAPAPT